MSTNTMEEQSNNEEVYKDWKTEIERVEMIAETKNTVFFVICYVGQRRINIERKQILNEEILITDLNVAEKTLRDLQGRAAPHKPNSCGEEAEDRNVVNVREHTLSYRHLAWSASPLLLLLLSFFFSTTGITHFVSSAFVRTILPWHLVILFSI